MADTKSDIIDAKEHIDQLGYHDDIPPLPSSLEGKTSEELAKIEKKAIFKLDLVIMPAITILYILNYLDRQNLAASKLATIEQDLNFTTQNFNTAVSILFVGYILMQVPSNLLVAKIQYPMIYICVCVVLWGIISACTAAVQSFGALLACRFMLGFFALRAGIMYSGSQLGLAFGTLLAIAILELEGVHGLAGWRWLFIIEGVLTVGLALIFATYMPNTINKIWNLSQEEADWVRWNYELDQKQQDHSDEVTAWKGFLMAVEDPKTWMMCACLYATYTAAAVNNFFPTVVAGLGFPRNVSYALTAPPFLLCVVCILLNGYFSDRRQKRFLHVMCPLLVTVLANIIAVSTLNVGARYFAMMLMPSSFYALAIIQLSWISGNLSQPSVKRGAAIALINCLCNTPNIWTAYTYYDEPQYVAAFGVNLGAAVIAVAFACVTYFYFRKQNQMMDQSKTLGKSGATAVQQAPGFRYIL